VKVYFVEHLTILSLLICT